MSVNVVTKKPFRVGEIELLRFVAAIAIMMTHAKNLVPDGTFVFFARGSLAVDFFFILSGYLMAVSAFKNQNNGMNLGDDTGSFMLKKIRGLMPDLLIACLFDLFLHLITLGVENFADLVHKLVEWVYHLVPISVFGFVGGKSGNEFWFPVWYISAMLIAMMILYPLCRKYFSMFTKVIGPLVALFILGFLAYNYGSTLNPAAYEGFVYRGLLRAVAEISLGAALFPFVNKLQNAKLGIGKRLLITILQIFCVVASVGWMLLSTDKVYNITCVFLFAGVVLLGFSRQGLLARFFDNGFCVFLGKISLHIYLVHFPIEVLIRSITKYYTKIGVLGEHPVREYVMTLVVYFAVTIAVSLLVLLISNLIRKAMSKSAAKAVA